MTTERPNPRPVLSRPLTRPRFESSRRGTGRLTPVLPPTQVHGFRAPHLGARTPWPAPLRAAVAVLFVAALVAAAPAAAQIPAELEGKVIREVRFVAPSGSPDVERLRRAVRTVAGARLRAVDVADSLRDLASGNEFESIGARGARG